MFDGNNITYYESPESNAIGTVIEIELTGVRAVNEIRILTKLDCHGEQISRFEIRVGNHEVSVVDVDAMKTAAKMTQPREHTAPSFLSVRLFRDILSGYTTTYITLP